MPPTPVFSEHDHTPVFSQHELKADDDSGMGAIPFEDSKHDGRPTHGASPPVSPGHSSLPVFSASLADDTMDLRQSSIDSGRSVPHTSALNRSVHCDGTSLPDLSVHTAVKGESLPSGNSNSSENSRWEGFPEQALKAMLSHQQESTFPIPQTLHEALHWQGPNAPQWRSRTILFVL